MTVIVFIGALVLAVARGRRLRCAHAIRGRAPRARARPAASRTHSAAPSSSLRRSIRAEVAERTLDAAVALPGVDGARCRRSEPRRRAHTSRRAECRTKKASGSAMQMPANPNLRAMDVVYRYRLDDVDKAASFPGRRSSCRSLGRPPIGTLSAFTRAPSTEFPEATVEALERLALRAGPGDRERPPLHRGPAPRRARLAHRAPQPPPLPRAARPRDCPRAPLRALVWR